MTVISSKARLAGLAGVASAVIGASAAQAAPVADPVHRAVQISSNAFLQEIATGGIKEASLLGAAATVLAKNTQALAERIGSDTLGGILGWPWF